MKPSALHQLAPLSKWPARNNQPLLISGSCSVETEEQYVETAVRLAKTNIVHLLRGGIWKPRS
jgi:chorismate mutase